MSRLSPKTLCFLVAFAISLPLDQISKRWIIDRFEYGELQTVVPDFFNLTHVRNPGGAFSLFADLPPFWGKAFFLTTGVFAIVLLLVFLGRLAATERLAATAIGAVLGGAIGNLTDRVLYGEVIDFLDFRLLGGYVWPTFNLADCWIVGGVAVLMVTMFFEEVIEEESPDASDPASHSGVP